jgi:hypothetical protein
MIPVRGRDEQNRRIVNVRRVWEIIDDDTPPRLANAYCKP